MMTFTLTQLWQIFLAMCGSLITIAGAGAIIIGLINKAKKPDTERDEALKRHAELLDNDNRRLKELEESNNIIMQSMLAIMSHAIDGNHVEDLEKARNDLQQYLIKRR
jgi:hypothetical protein